MAKKKASTKPTLPAPLPKGILMADLKRPAMDKKTYEYTDWARVDGSAHRGPHLEFEMWYVERFGWCIPTLQIRKAGRRHLDGAAPRTYAVAVYTEKVVRIGLGPHVKARVNVFVRKSRLKELQKFVELQGQGMEEANEIRDSISTRRARTAQRRRNFGTW